MKTYHLKDADEAVLQAALDEAGLCITDEDGNVSYYGQCGDFTLDWIGEIFEPTGVILDEGAENERPEMVSVGGYHCNVYSRKPLPDSLTGYLVEKPTTPARKLAGF